MTIIKATLLALLSLLLLTCPAVAGQDDPPQQLERALAQLTALARRGPATLDWDGTLCRGDVGEGFFRWMIAKKLYPAARLPLLRKRLKDFEQGKITSEAFYNLMVSGLAGLREDRVQALARTYFSAHHKDKIYRPMMWFVRALKREGFTPWVVSGSPYWVVAAGAELIGIPAERVIGLRLRADEQGRLTDKLVTPIPWKQGKAAAILKQIGRPPLISAGNSHGDLWMMKIARALKIAVNPGAKVLQQAQAEGWIVQTLTAGDTVASEATP